MSQPGPGFPSTLLFVSLGLGFHPVCDESARAWGSIKFVMSQPGPGLPSSLLFVSLGLGFHRQPGPGLPSSLL